MALRVRCRLPIVVSRWSGSHAPVVTHLEKGPIDDTPLFRVVTPCGKPVRRLVPRVPRITPDAVVRGQRFFDRVPGCPPRRVGNRRRVYRDANLGAPGGVAHHQRQQQSCRCPQVSTSLEKAESIERCPAELEPQLDRPASQLADVVILHPGTPGTDLVHVDHVEPVHAEVGDRISLGIEDFDPRLTQAAAVYIDLEAISGEDQRRRDDLATGVSGAGTDEPVPLLY